MKTAKNGKSSFENLATVIDKLEEDQFAEILEKTKGKTKIFLGLLRQRLAKNPIDIVSEHDFPEVQTRNFPKLIENAYARVLALVAELWKKDEAKEWQENIRKRIDEIEGLCFIELYDLAAVQLANLEEHLFEDGNNEKVYRFFDDWVLISRIANLKMFLDERSEGILDSDSFDKTIHSCYWVGSDLLKEKEIHEWALLESKAVYHNFIGHSCLSQQKLNEYISITNRHLEQIRSRNDVHHNFTRILNWQIALAYFKNGMYSEAQRTVKGIDYEYQLPSLVVLQQFFELMLVLKIEKNDLQAWQNLQGLQDQYHYDKEQIKVLHIRLELNQLLIQFLQGKYPECLLQIEGLKQSERKLIIADRAVYRNVLFLELLANWLNKSYSHISGLIRSLDKLCDKDTFEYIARKILMKTTKYPSDFPLKSLGNEEPEKFNELKALSKNGEPMHALILSFLKGNFRPKNH